MKNFDIGQLTTILAHIGVIVGIVFLALELNQKNALLESAAKTTRVEIRIQGWNRMSEDPAIVGLLIKDRSVAPLRFSRGRKR